MTLRSILKCFQSVLASSEVIFDNQKGILMLQLGDGSVNNPASFLSVQWSWATEKTWGHFLFPYTQSLDSLSAICIWVITIDFVSV